MALIYIEFIATCRKIIHMMDMLLLQMTHNFTTHNMTHMGTFPLVSYSLVAMIMNLWNLFLTD